MTPSNQAQIREDISNSLTPAKSNGMRAVTVNQTVRYCLTDRPLIDVGMG